MPALSVEGESTSWLQQKKNVGRIFTEFAEQDDDRAG